MKKLLVILITSLSLYPGYFQTASATALRDELSISAGSVWNGSQLVTLLPNSPSWSKSERTAFSMVLLTPFADSPSNFEEYPISIRENSVPASPSADSLSTASAEAFAGEHFAKNWRFAPDNHGYLGLDIGKVYAGESIDVDESSPFRVPEPATMLLFGTGLASLASFVGSRSRKKSSSLFDTHL